MNDLELIENELSDKQIVIVGKSGIRRAGMSMVNVGTIGHIDHGKKNISVLAALVLSAPPEIPECYLESENLKQPYYRRFEKKRW